MSARARSMVPRTARRSSADLPTAWLSESSDISTVGVWSMKATEPTTVPRTCASVHGRTCVSAPSVLVTGLVLRLVGTARLRAAVGSRARASVDVPRDGGNERDHREPRIEEVDERKQDEDDHGKHVASAPGTLWLSAAFPVHLTASPFPGVPIVQRPRTWPFQGQNTGSNPVGDESLKI